MSKALAKQENTISPSVQPVLQIIAEPVYANTNYQTQGIDGNGVYIHQHSNQNYVIAQ